MKPRRSPSWLLFALAAIAIPAQYKSAAAEANPAPPHITITASNGQPRLVFPYPAAARYSVLSSGDATQPLAPDVSGWLLGPMLIVTNHETCRIYKVGV